MQGRSQSGEVPFEGEIANENVAEFFAAFLEGERNQFRGDLIRRTYIDQAGVISRKQFGDRSPASCQNRQAKSGGFDEVHRLIFILIKCWKAEQISFAQQFVFARTRNESQMLDNSSGGRIAERGFEFLGLGSGHEIARNEQLQGQW